MKKNLTYHGQMMKQEAEALLKALTLGDEAVVMSIEKRLRGFADDIVDGKATVFNDTESSYRELINHTFKMAEKCGTVRETFEITLNTIKGNHDAMNDLLVVLDERYDRYLKMMNPMANTTADTYRVCIEKWETSMGR